jgi:plastocyanin
VNLLPASRRQLVEARTAIVRRLAPRGRDEALGFQPLERRIEGALLDPQDALGRPANVIRDAEPVFGPMGKSGQNEHVERALHEGTSRFLVSHRFLIGDHTTERSARFRHWPARRQWPSASHGVRRICLKTNGIVCSDVLGGVKPDLVHADTPLMVAEPRVYVGVPRRLGLTLACACLAGLCCTVGAFQEPAAGAVTGQVHVIAKSSRRLISAGAYPGRVVGVPADHDPSELANVVVFVKAKATPSAPQHARLRQSREEFVPHLVAITAGSVVDFPNDDLIFHNVFSLSRVAVFDLGRYPRGTSRRWTFKSPGLVKVFCQLHSHMNALIRVFDHPYFAVPDNDGRFAIPGVPAGRYDVVAWHERAGEVTESAVIPAGGAAELAFSLPLTDKK